jgi:hypothetical protein
MLRVAKLLHYFAPRCAQLPLLKEIQTLYSFSRITLLLVFILLLPFSACKDASVNSSTSAEALHFIRGKALNLASSDSITLVAGRWINIAGRGDSFYVFGTAYFYGDGDFLMTLAPPPREILQPFIQYPEVHCGGDSAKFIYSDFYLHHTDDSTMGKYFYNSSTRFAGDYDTPSQLGDYWCAFEYVDRDVSVACEYEAWYGTYSLVDTLRVHSHLDFKMGWNRIVSTKVSVRAHFTLMERTVRNGNDGNWYFAP